MDPNVAKSRVRVLHRGAHIVSTSICQSDCTTVQNGVFQAEVGLGKLAVFSIGTVAQYLPWHGMA